MRTVKTDIGKVHSPRQMPHKLLTKGRLATTLRPVRAVVRWGATEADWLRSRRDRADLAIFHEFRPPPYGGGNQFLLALVRELESRGLAVEANLLSGGTPACLYNSFNFDFRRLRRFAREGVRMVHRVDGPIGGSSTSTTSWRTRRSSSRGSASTSTGSSGSSFAIRS